MLQFAGISKKYGKRPVLSDVSFTLSPGECLGVAGHNGSGKSTLLSIVAQVETPDSGTMHYNGANVMRDRRFLKHCVGYVPQRNSLLADLTVGETLRFWQQMYGQKQDLFAPGALCSQLGLQELAKKKVGALSGGMQKRLSAALGMMHSPALLIMDEALPAMDRHYRKVLYNWLYKLKSQGTSLLYCSHEVEELKSFCDAILLLQEGRVVYYGPSQQFPSDQAWLDQWMNPVHLTAQS